MRQLRGAVLMTNMQLLLPGNLPVMKKPLMS